MLSESRLARSFATYFQRSYLGKWVVIGIIIGLAAGLGSTAFYYAIQLVTNTALGGIVGFVPPNPAGEPVAPVLAAPNYLLIPIATTLGGLAAGFLIFGFAPEAEGHGTDAAIDAFHNKGGVVRRRVPLIKTIASALTIGSGGSAGREGPTAQIAAGIGSIAGEIFGLSTRDRRIAVAAGIGAGIGSIFKSPFGGAILSAEVLYSAGDMEAEALIPAFIATPLGYVLFASLSGPTGFLPLFGNTVQYSFTKPANLLIYILLGALCAAVGRFYTYTFYRTKRTFDGLRITRFLKPAIGAALAGLIAIFFPEVLGMGYGFVQYVIDGQLTRITANFIFAAAPLLLILVVLVFAKIAAIALTIASGGCGGVFAPALGIGGYLGASVWVAFQAVPALQGWIPNPAPLVIVGMMAMFAGVGRAPIAAVLMVSEMTGTLALLAPSMVAVVTSYYLVGPAFTIYRSQVRRRSDSPAHRGEYHVPVMKNVLVRDALNPKVITLTTEDTVERAYRILSERGFGGIPIVKDHAIVGMLAVRDVLAVPRDKLAETSVSKVMTTNVVLAYPEETLLEALEKMTLSDVGRLPVVRRGTRVLLGILTRTDLFRAYDRAVTSIQTP